jgi:hypothetical protein
MLRLELFPRAPCQLDGTCRSVSLTCGIPSVALF